VGELDLVRHYTRLSRRNVGVTTHFYPLGSCTMKYNPEAMLREAGRSENAYTHPLAAEADCQGILKILQETERWLAKISGLPHISLQPAAGAQGELAALLVMRKALDARGDRERRIILIPDSAHGTNPASATMAGCRTRTVKSSAEGLVSVEDLKRMAGPDTAGLMITNPNTLGLFERDIREICRVIHDAGGYVYMDGANLNAIMGITRPGDFGVDAMHFNLHKTFATPHGMGGPGAGPIGVVDELAPHLPVPRIEEREGTLFLDYDRPESIGAVRGFYGNVAVAAMAWTYMNLLGREGIERVARTAVLNANYLLSRLREHLPVPHDRQCMHEFVMSAKGLHKETGVSGMDVSKAILDRGFHSPTTYFPLIVEEALMTEPTETESKDEMDAFAEAVAEIVKLAREDPEAVKAAPCRLDRSRPDEVKAMKEPRLRWQPPAE